MVVRISDKKQNYNNVTKLLVKPKKYNDDEDDDISEFFAKQGANYSLDTNGIRNKEDLYAYYEAIEKV